jgi:hypothetical protein
MNYEGSPGTASREPRPRSGGAGSTRSDEMARQDAASSKSPTLPLPPPRISLEDFVEVASAAALRSLNAHAREAVGKPQPVPWRPQIWMGFILSMEGGLFTQGAPQGGPGGIGAAGGGISSGG